MTKTEVMEVAKNILKFCAEAVFYTACGMAGGFLTLGIIGLVDRIRNR